MLLDLVTLVKPALSILDGVVGMDGDGPSAGEPRHMGFLVMGRSAVHVDWAFSRLIGLEPTLVPVIEAAVQRGWVNKENPLVEAGSIPLTGALVEGFRLPETLDPLGYIGRLPFPGVWSKLLRSLCTLKPYIPENACKGCGVCQQNCPEAAIEIDSGRARIDHTRCIRCYCCHEVCPEKIVEVRGSLFYRCLRPLSGRVAQRAR
jgi:Pyruvate/2-oxoacid:ferredoxin oxidoreductase delta subunit